MKNLFNSGKKKVAAGALAVALVGGTSFGLANTDLGAQLQAWYDGQFNTSVDNAVGAAEQYGAGVASDILSEYNMDKKASAVEIINHTNKEIADGTTEINNARDGHVGNVEDTKENILEQSEFKFFQLFTQGVLEIEAVAQQGKDAVEAEFPGITEKLGDTSVARAEKDLEEAKNNAVASLEDAIANAQSELEADLDAKSSNLTYNLKQHINFNAADVREFIDELIADLTQEQKDIITAAAETKVEEAKDALDDVVVSGK